MKLIKLSAIKIPPNRQRAVFPAAAHIELRESIRERGLLQAPVIRIEGDVYVLVAGQRRLRAITDLYDLEETFKHDGEIVRKGFVPYTLFQDLDPLAAEEAEADENLAREDLTWEEESAWLVRLEDIRKRRAEASGLTPPTVADLAAEVGRVPRGGEHEKVRRQLIVGKNLHNPIIKGAKNADEAYKLLKKDEESSRMRTLGEKVGRTFSAEMHKAINADACEWLKHSPAEIYDVILTDPPYGMGADSFGDSGSPVTGDHTYSDTYENWKRLMADFIPHSFRVAKAEAHAYVFCDIDNFFDLRLWMSEAGWWVFRTPLIWHLSQGFRMPWPEHGPQRKYETILYAVKGKRPALIKAPDVISVPREFDQPHAAQKPVALFEDLLSRSARPGDSVLDPFCGSGTIFPACHSRKCRAVGVELDPASYGVAVRRIEALKDQLELGL